MWKREWLGILLLVMFLADRAWEHYRGKNLQELMAEVCIEGLKVGALKPQMTFLEIETLARDESKQSPKMNLADIANLSHKAQQPPTDMDQAIQQFVECTKLGKK